jgi:UDP-N-acetylmuramate: L-alanyl-gamma-D-glutamyl-meso-diaminopimelate ligase
MRIHLISIGGAVMHNFALALASQGHSVTGSDDHIFEPSKSRLAEQNLLPAEMGWSAERIDKKLDLVILGMHAKNNNPELLRAKKLGIPIYSFPEFTFQNAKNKKRIVVAGSHGKTTTTGMLMHVYKQLNQKFDYLVGSQLDGYDRMVQFSHAEKIIIEGDEYLSSPLDLNPKFLHYKPQLSMITGIAWDHINVFPTFDNYIAQFKRYLDSLPANATCFYNEKDETLNNLCIHYSSSSKNINLLPYGILEYKNTSNGIDILHEDNTYAMPWFGEHNVSNATGAMKIAESDGIPNEQFLRAMQSFGGTARRLEEIYNKNNLKIIRDFAHSPSKVKATTSAIKEQYPERNVVAVLELHTFSSLQKEFLQHYKDSLSQADLAFVYVDHKVFEQKQMPELSSEEIKDGFGNHVQVIKNKDALNQTLSELKKENMVLALMSSGSFSGLQIEEII